jgi:hypothetical protein
MTETPVEVSTRIASDRPLRICDVCGGVDDHPRHSHVEAPGVVPVNQEHLTKVIADESLSAADRARIVADIVDTTTQLRHMDCCRAVGCPDGTCNVLPPVTGAALLDHIQSVVHETNVANLAAQAADEAAAAAARTEA